MPLLSVYKMWQNLKPPQLKIPEIHIKNKEIYISIFSIVKQNNKSKQDVFFAGKVYSVEGFTALCVWSYTVWTMNYLKGCALTTHPMQNNKVEQWSWIWSNCATFKTRGEKTMSESAGQIFRIRSNVKSHINRMEGNCCLARSNNTWTKRAGFFCEAKSMTNDLELSAANVWHLDHERVLCEFLLAAELEQNKNTTASTARVLSCPSKHHLALQCKWDSSLSWPEFLTDLLLHVINHSALG